VGRGNEEKRERKGERKGRVGRRKRGEELSLAPQLKIVPASLNTLHCRPL